MAEKPERKCDVDDILCQMELLGKMKNLHGAFQDEDFRKEFPSLVELEPQLSEAINTREANIRQVLERCNLPPLEEIESEESTLEPEDTGGLPN